jgi:death-on-curing protein
VTESDWPDAEHLLHLFAHSTGPGARVRDPGILVAVAARPCASILGTVIYPTLLHQSAAVLHAALAWRPLELWNAGLGWAAAFAILTRNGLDLSISAWEQMIITDEIVSGRLDQINEIVERLAPHLRTC